MGALTVIRDHELPGVGATVVSFAQTFGGVASGAMVFGMSYLYGLLGTTDITRFAEMEGGDDKIIGWRDYFDYATLEKQLCASPAVA